MIKLLFVNPYGLLLVCAAVYFIVISLGSATYVFGKVVPLLGALALGGLGLWLVVGGLTIIGIMVLCIGLAVGKFCLETI